MIKVFLWLCGASGAKRQLKKANETGQAIPLRCGTNLKLLETSCCPGQKRLVDLRNRAFLFVAYNTLMRMSEISRIRVGDLDQTGDNCHATYFTHEDNNDRRRA